LTYGCAVPYNKESLESVCNDEKTSAWIKTFDIFNNLKEFTKFGKWGNADIYTTKDWNLVKEDPSFAKLGDAVWHESNQTCLIYSSVLIKIIYGKTGFDENPQ